MHTERNDGRSMSLYVNLKLCPLHLIDARIRKQQDRVDTWRKSGKRERLANRSTGIHQTTLHGGGMRERAVLLIELQSPGRPAGARAYILVVVGQRAFRRQRRPAGTVE